MGFTDDGGSIVNRCAIGRLLGKENRFAYGHRLGEVTVDKGRFREPDYIQSQDVVPVMRETLATPFKTFFKQFPDDDACFDHLMSIRCGDSIERLKCCKTGKFSRIKKMPAQSCAWCGHHSHPMLGTPLQKWFYAMHLFTTSRLTAFRRKTCSASLA